MNLRSPIAALAVLALVTGAVLADPFTENLDLMVNETAERLADLTGDLTKQEAKERKALLKAEKAFAKVSTSVVGDLKMYAKVAKTWLKVYPIDPEIEFLVDDALSAFSSDLTVALNQMALDLAGLEDSKEKAKAMKLFTKAQAAMAAAALETDRSKKAKLYGKAEKSRLKAAAIIEPLLGS
jgi:hypothetical protein